MSDPNRPRPGYIIYDVADDRQRQLIRNLLKFYGDPVQQSTWLIDLRAAPPLAGLTEGLRSMLDDGDRLLALRQCPDCRQANATQPGHARAAEQPGPTLQW